MRANSKILNEIDKQIIELIANGHSYARVAEVLGLNELVIQEHVRRMMQENSFTSPFQLITWAYQDGILI